MTDGERESDEELHNSRKKLHNFSHTSNGEEVEPVEQLQKTKPAKRLVNKITGDIIYYDDQPQLPSYSPYVIETKGPEGWIKCNDAAIPASFSPLFSPASEDRVKSDSDEDAPLALHFTQEQLEAYVAHRSQTLAPKSLDWINRASQALWDCTHGEISEKTMTGLRTFILERYSSLDSHRKALGFAVAFLKRLSTTRAEPLLNSYAVYLELPKKIKVRKTVTERILTRDDIVETLKRIDVAETEGNIKASKARNYRAFVLLASFTGLRPSTIRRLTVGQVRAALKDDKPALHVLAEQEKNRVEHWVPVHPTVAAAAKEVLVHDFGKNEDEKNFFMFNSFEKWLERQRVPLPLVEDPKKAHLWLSDFRKFAEQFGDVISWDATNRKYILAHGMTGVDWGHYKAPQREDVFDIYMKAWRDVDLKN